jgi:hypothetical protein
MAANKAALQEVLRLATSKALTRAAIQVQNEARRLCPVDTGTLRRSINFVVEGESAESMRARVGTNVDYALNVERGTGIYGPHGTPIVPVHATMLRFPVKGGAIVFARSVKGRRATPFLKPALAAMTREA